MSRRTNTYAIRLAVEGGGQVEAELVSVGQSGEQSLKRIESAGERASGGLKGLGRRAELLRTSGSDLDKSKDRATARPGTGCHNSIGPEIRVFTIRMEHDSEYFVDCAAIKRLANPQGLLEHWFL
jgi:hypothetical protein